MDMENNEPVKRGRGRPPGPQKSAMEIIKKPSAVAQRFPTTVEIPEGDNNKYTSMALAIMRLPKIDLKTPGTATVRIDEYFQLCADHDMKPAVTGLALALGLDRRRLWEVKTNQDRQLPIPQENKDAIIMAYDSLEFMWETYVQNGKINPVSAIFLGKNNFGYKDQQEYVLTPNQMGETVPREVLEAKYDELPD